MIGKLATQLADIKLWRQDLASAQVLDMTQDQFREWVVGQMRDNLAPLLVAEAQAVSHEVGEVGEAVSELDAVVNELIEHEESYLRPELAEALSANLAVGVEICQLIVSLKPDDELNARKLQKLIKTYQQQAVVLLDEIEDITAEDEEDNDGDTGSGLHDEGGHSEGADSGGEEPVDDSGSTEPTDSSPGNGGE